jgi:RNA polymerase sigma-70 factor (ECF subfamily)
MRRSISPDDLIVLQHVADRVARRTRHRLGLPEQDLDDLRQDLLLDLISRYPTFDRERSPLEAFAHMVATHRASRIGRAVWRERQIYGCSPLSLDASLAGDDNAVVGDLFSENQGLAALFGQTFDVEGEVATSTSLDIGLSGLAAEDQRLCAALVTSTIDQLAASGHGARASLYRRLKDIRMTLLAHGVEAV